MKKNTTVLALAFAFVALCAAACTKEGVKAGDPCNGPGTCKSPLSCYESPKGKLCGSSCDFEMGKHTCKDPALASVQTEVNGLAAGCVCLPK